MKRETPAFQRYLASPRNNHCLHRIREHATCLQPSWQFIEISMHQECQQENKKSRQVT